MLSFLENGAAAEWFTRYVLASFAVGVVCTLILVLLRRAPIQHRNTVAVAAVGLLAATLPASFFLVPRGGGSDSGAVNPSGATALVKADVEGAGPEIVTAPTVQDGTALTGRRVEPVTKPTANPIPWLNGVAVIALAGSCFLFGRLSAGIWALRRLRECLPPMDGDDIIEAQEHLAIEGGLTLSRADIFVSQDNLTPFCFGVLRPSIVLPQSIALHPEQLRMVMAHEMTHLKNRDPAFGFLQRAAVALQWWNPFAHFISREFSLVRETLCDRRVIEITGDPSAYARFLVEVSETAGRPKRALASAAAVGTFDSLKQRIKTLGRQGGAGRLAWVYGIGTAALAGAAAFSLVSAAATDLSAHAAPTEPIAPADGLLCYLPMREDFHDHSPAAAEIEVFGDAKVSDGIGVFDGDGDFLQLPALDFAGRPFAVSVWLNLTGRPSSYGILEQKGAHQPREHLYLMLRGGNTVGREGGIPWFGMFVNDISGEGAVRLEHGWAHLVFQYDGSRSQIWRDGQPDTLKMKAPYRGKAKPIMIGQAPSLDGLETLDWMGGMCELRIYERALDATEIDTLYRHGIATGIEPGQPDFSYQSAIGSAPDQYLVGLNAWSENGAITGLQPVLSDSARDTSLGEVIGDARGNIETFIAEAPYVVGGMFLHKTDQISGIRLLYLKRVGDKLDPTEFQLSEWSGTPPPPGGFLVSIGGDGRPITGFAARFRNSILIHLGTYGLGEARANPHRKRYLQDAMQP